MRFVNASDANRIPSSLPSCDPCEVASIAALRSPASSISRNARWRSIASGVVRTAGRISPPTLARSCRAGRACGPRPRGSNGSGTRSSSCRSFPLRPRSGARPRGAEELGRGRGHRAARVLDDTCGTFDATGRSTTSAAAPESIAPIRELVPVEPLSAHAEEERARRNGAGVVREIRDLDARIPDHLARGQALCDAC